MKVLHDPKEWQKSCGEITQGQKRTLGFVPTMGALHEGHLSLIRQATRENDRVTVSIFVNPTQFNELKDFELYPRTLEKDLHIISQVCPEALVFSPQDPSVMYPHHYLYRVRELEVSQKFCGAFRPGHFEGVLTVVMKLLWLAQPTKIYLGEKDFQQLQLIQGMVQEFFIPVEVIPVTTVRDQKGYPLSSRNARLSSSAFSVMEKVFKAIQCESIDDCRLALEKLPIRIEYLEEWRGRRMIAYWLEGVRLIDNVEIPEIKK